MKDKTDSAHRLLKLLDRELALADLDLLSSFNRRRLVGLLDHWARLAERVGGTNRPNPASNEPERP